MVIIIQGGPKVNSNTKKLASDFWTILYINISTTALIPTSFGHILAYPVVLGTMLRVSK